MPEKPTRDRFIDALRGGSIAIVVVGHWLAADVRTGGGPLRVLNTLEEAPWLWPLTWPLQVMPLFFLAGGFSNLRSWRSAQQRGEREGAFLAARMRRLLVPVIPLVGVWMALSLGLELWQRPWLVTAERAFQWIGRPLWFLSGYLVVLALLPLTLRLHQRFGVAVPVAMAVAAPLVDLVRFSTGLEGLGQLNSLFVWLLPHQLGFVYAEGRLRDWRRVLALGLLSLAALCALVALGPYSPSLIGVADGRVSNNSPPTAVLTAQALALLGFSLALRPWIERLTSRARAARVVEWFSQRSLSLFLWHTTAMVPVAALLVAVGAPQPAASSAPWWAMKAVAIALAWPPLLGLLVLFARRPRPGLGEPPGRLGALVAAVLGSVAMMAFVRAGFGVLHPLPAQLASLPVPVSPLSGAVRLAFALWLLSGRTARVRREEAVLLGLGGLALLALVGPPALRPLLALSPSTAALDLGLAGLLLAERLGVSAARTPAPG